MFRIHALPAGNGDSLLLEYGTPGEKHHILVDGGRSGFSPKLIAHLRAHAPVLDLVVVTHVDLDHICGILGLLAASSAITVKEIWFNGFVHLEPRETDHLAEVDLLGPEEGEELTELIVKRKIPWNERFDGGSIVVPGSGKLPQRTVAGMKLTVLSPTWETLGALREIWPDLVRGEGLVRGVVGPRRDDDDVPSDVLGDEDDLQALADHPPPKKITEANRSSVALLAEYEGRRCLLAGDAAPDVLVASLKRLSAAPPEIHLLKVPHHGSHANVTSALIQQVRCGKYLFTTDGTGYTNPHPHDAAVARVAVYGGVNPTLLFNYDCDTTTGWRRLSSDPDFPCTVRYGTGGLLSETV
jgi:beta-lactamase superfamily II metal-dependent hydrolase